MLRRNFAVSLMLAPAMLGQQPDIFAQDPSLQDPSKRPRLDPLGKEPEARLPNGKLQRDEILKDEHEKSLRDAADMMRLSEELKQELEKAGSFVVSVQTIKKTEEIEKLARRIRGRLKHS